MEKLIRKLRPIRQEQKPVSPIPSFSKCIQDNAMRCSLFEHTCAAVQDTRGEGLSALAIQSLAGRYTGEAHVFGEPLPDRDPLHYALENMATHLTIAREIYATGGDLGITDLREALRADVHRILGGPDWQPRPLQVAQLASA